MASTAEKTSQAPMPEYDRSGALRNAERLLFMDFVSHEDWGGTEEFAHNGEIVRFVYQKCLAEHKTVLAERIRQRFGHWLSEEEGR